MVKNTTSWDKSSKKICLTRLPWFNTSQQLITTSHTLTPPSPPWWDGERSWKKVTWESEGKWVEKKNSLIMEIK